MSVSLQTAVTETLYGPLKEQLLLGQQLMVKQINSKPNGDSAAVKLTEEQICRETVSYLEKN